MPDTPTADSECPADTTPDGEWVCDAFLDVGEGVCAYCGQLDTDHAQIDGSGAAQ